MIPKPTVVATGWREIGAATNRNPQTLAMQHSYGRLPVSPIKLPNGRVGMTQEQINALREAKK